MIVQLLSDNYSYDQLILRFEIMRRFDMFPITILVIAKFH
jgi:hypothetical protein